VIEHREVPPAVAWRRSDAWRGLVTAAPAAVAASQDVRLGAALAVGLLPVCAVVLPPRRADRPRLALYGVLAAASVLCGGAVAPSPVLAVACLLLAGGAAGHLVARSRRPEAVIVLVLCLPLLAMGFSFPGVAAAGALALDLLLGTAWALLVAVAWPGRPRGVPAPRRTAPDLRYLVPYGWTAGAAGAVCAATGFLAGLQHVGWAPAAALLVMRPVASTQRLRSVGRLLDVVAGALVAIVLVELTPPAGVWVVALAAVVAGATATSGSRWYVLPAFTTFLVLVLLLVDDPSAAGARFWERLLETALGVGVAAVAGLVVLPAVRRRSAGR
jgi:hypothetical protein